MWLYILIFVLAFFILARSSSFLVKSLTGLARFFKISEYAVAFIFMSLVTSLPELFVGFSSAITGIPEFSFGNVLGSNLLKVTLMIGLIVVLGKGLHISSKISKRNFWIITGFAFLPLLLSGDGVISRGDGLILLLAFAFYILKLKKETGYFSKTVNGSNHKKLHSPREVFQHLSRFSIGVAMLMVSSYAIVWSGKNLAQDINLSFFSFGILFVAIGTSLPEITFGIRAKMLKHGSMSMGNILGSVAFNSMLVLGVVSLINPIEIVFSLSLASVVGFSILAFLLFNAFAFSKSSVSRKEGVILLLVYIAFLVFEYFANFM